MQIRVKRCSQASAGILLGGFCDRSNKRLAMGKMEIGNGDTRLEHCKTYSKRDPSHYYYSLRNLAV